MTDSLIQLCDDLFSMTMRMKHPRCSVDGNPGEIHQGTGCYIYRLENHHILEKGLYPVFRYDPNNSIILSIPRHTGGIVRGEQVNFFAHQEAEFNRKDGNGIRNQFDYWLQINHNDKWSWKEENKHRKHEPLKDELPAIYGKLRREFEETKETIWMNLESEQMDPRQYPGPERVE